MFMVDYELARRKKPRRRYWWGAMGFAVGLWLGITAAHRLESMRPPVASAATQGAGAAFAAKGGISGGDRI